MFTQKPKDYRVLKDDKKTVRWLDYVQEMRMLNCKANIKVYWGKHNLRILIAHELTFTIYQRYQVYALK